MNNEKVTPKQRALRAVQKWARYRDCFLYGTCISCDRPIRPNACDGGHYIARGNAPCPSLEVDERNVHAQCYECNRMYGGAHREYRIGLIKRYGERYPKILELIRQASQGGSSAGLGEADKLLAEKRYTDDDYIAIAEKYEAKLKEMLNGKA